MGPVFANNVGADDTIVYGGLTGAPLSLSSSFTGPAGQPKAFDIFINPTTPFFTIQQPAIYCSMFATSVEVFRPNLMLCLLPFPIAVARARSLFGLMAFPYLAQISLTPSL